MRQLNWATKTRGYWVGEMGGRAGPTQGRKETGCRPREKKKEGFPKKRVGGGKKPGREARPLKGKVP